MHSGWYGLMFWYNCRYKCRPMPDLDSEEEPQDEPLRYAPPTLQSNADKKVPGKCLWNVDDASCQSMGEITQSWSWFMQSSQKWSAPILGTYLGTILIQIQSILINILIGGKVLNVIYFACFFLHCSALENLLFRISALLTENGSGTLLKASLGKLMDRRGIHMWVATLMTRWSERVLCHRWCQPRREESKQRRRRKRGRFVPWNRMRYRIV